MYKRQKYVRIAAHSGSRDTVVRDYADDPCNNARQCNASTNHRYMDDRQNIVNVHRNLYKPMERCLQSCQASGRPVVDFKNKSVTGDHRYKIPGNQPTNQYFRKQGILHDWVLQYSHNSTIVAKQPIPFLHPGDEIRVYEIEEIEALNEPIQQRYRQGNAQL